MTHTTPPDNSTYLLLSDDMQKTLVYQNNEFIRILVGYRLATKEDIDTYIWILENQIGSIKRRTKNITYTDVRDSIITKE